MKEIRFRGKRTDNGEWAYGHYVNSFPPTMKKKEKYKMKIKFPRNVVVDTDNIPENFEEQIHKSFEEYTKGTAKEYTYQDKLLYIDVCRKLLHRAENTEDCVLSLMKELLEYEVLEQGEIPGKEEYLSTEFMEQCYEAGRTNLYAHYTGNRHVDDIIMDLLCRAIKVVMDFERGEDE